MDEPQQSGAAGTSPYRVTTRVRVFATALAALAGLIFHLLLRLSRDAGQVGGNPLLWGCLLLGVLPATWFAVVAWTSRLQLSATALTLHHPFGGRELRLAELRGVRSRYTRSGRRLARFEPRHGRPLSLLLPYTTDHRYERWLASLPDLDADDRAASTAVLLHDPRLGADPAARARQLARWSRIARWDDGAAMLLLTWTLLWPHPYAWVLATLAAAPWLALLLAWLSGGALRINLRRHDARPQAVSVLLIAPMLLVMRTAFDLDLLDWGRACLLGVLAGLPLLLVIVVAQRADERPLGATIFHAVFCCLYGAGVVAAGNVLLDRAAPGVFPARVVDRHATHGKGASYKLRLSGALPAGHDDWYAVSPSRYDATRPGHTVCVWRHPGALGLPWVVLADCPD